MNRSKTPAVTPGEDPFAWRDARGVLHTLLHVNSNSKDGPSLFGAHGFSLDGGHTWHAPQYDASTQPGGGPTAYTGRVAWSNGTTSVLYRRERPQLLFAGGRDGRSGAPAFLFNSAEACEPGGAAHDGGLACRSWTMVQAISSK